MRHILSLLLCSLIFGAASSQAALRYDLKTPGLAATVDGAPISQTALELIWRMAQQRKPEVAQVEVLASVLEDRLLAAYALQHYPRAQLLNENRVGFHPDIALHDQLVTHWSAVFHRDIEAALAAFKGGNIRGAITAQEPMSEADWRAVLGAPGKLLLDYRLSEAGRQAAAAKTLLRYRFDAKHSGQISFAEVYDAQNVQGRNRLHQRDQAFLTEAQGQLLASRFVRYWVGQRSGLAPADIAVVEQAVQDRALREGLSNVLGITADMHTDNAHLKRLAAQVSPADVQAFYQANKALFKRIEKVKAAHIQLPDFDTANRAYGELRRGREFAAVARQYSQAPSAQQGGELGWLVHDGSLPSWLQAVAFTQKPGTVSKPFRSPAAPGVEASWEILRVDERVEGYQPAQSESVRYTAGQALARRQAVKQFQDIRAELLATADIRISPALRPARGKAE